jgi:hypothetical protein
MPTTKQAETLFEDRQGADPLDWLQPLGVRFDVPKNENPQNLNYLVALWLRETFTSSDDRQRAKPINAHLLVLKTGRMSLGRLKLPAVRTQNVGTGCNSPSLFPGCNVKNKQAGGFILWVHPTTAEERAQYW